MKIRVTLKDPDTMHDAVHAAVVKHVRTMEGLSACEINFIVDERTSDLSGVIAEKWMRYSEYLTVDFDTEAGTATVVPNIDTN